MYTANKDVKDYATANGVYLWEVSEKFGILDSNFSRKLRRELSDEDKAKFKAIVDEIASERN